MSHFHTSFQLKGWTHILVFVSSHFYQMSDLKYHLSLLSDDVLPLLWLEDESTACPRMEITSEPADVLNIWIVLWIFPVFVLVVLLVLLVDVPVALGAHLGRANPLPTRTHAEIKGFLKCIKSNLKCFIILFLGSDFRSQLIAVASYRRLKRDFGENQGNARQSTTRVVH